VFDYIQTFLSNYKSFTNPLNMTGTCERSTGSAELYKASSLLLAEPTVAIVLCWILSFWCSCSQNEKADSEKAVYPMAA